jgi:PKD repeat protein
MMVCSLVAIDSAGAAALDLRVAASSNDAEESASGTMSLASLDLQLVHNITDQTVGMRWTGLAIPPGSTITAAYIQFASRTTQSVATNLLFQGQAADNSPTFGTTSGDISTRARTVAASSWAPVAWSSGETSAKERTPDLSAVIQEVVGRPGWASGNALVVIVTGTGQRTAWSFDGKRSKAPLLHVEYRPPDLPPVASLAVTQVASPALTVSANASGSTDTDATPIASYHFDFGDGSPIVTTTAPTATAQHTYATAGNHTVTLTVTDTGNLTSSPVSATINVTSGQVAVYAGYYDTHHAVNTQPKPNPWKGSPSTVFVGQQDNQPGDPPGGGWDTSTLRIDNLTTGSLTVVATVDIGSEHYALWGSRAIPAGQHLVLAQTAFENFDGSETSPAGCYGCDPNLCVTMRVSTVPVVHVTIGGVTTDYFDTGQMLNTHGADAAGCPYVGGPLPQTRYDESEAWVQIYPSGSAPSQTSPPAEGWGSPAANLPPRTLWLAPPAPNPSRGELAVRFTTPRHGPVRVSLYDLAGRVVHRFVENVLEPGDYSFRVDLADVRPGIYFLSLWTPEATRHEKFVLMR